VASLPIQRVIAALQALGFRPILDDRVFTTYYRLDTERGVCVIVVDAGLNEIWQEALINELDLHGVSLADFWNLYDATGDT